MPQILTIRVTNPGNVLRLCQYSWHNPASGSSREEPKKRRRTCTIGDAWNGHIGKRLATTRQLAGRDEFRGPGQRSVGCRMLYVIYDQEFHRAFGRLQLEPELFLHGDEHGRT